MDGVYTILVSENYTDKLESILNIFRIGLHNRDRSKVFDYRGYRVVNYTIICTEQEYISITNALNANYSR